MGALWLLLNVGGPWIARDLYGWLGCGFPFGFWFAAQGSLFLYLLLILVLVVLCERLERRYVAQAWGEGDRSDAPSDNR